MDVLQFTSQLRQYTLCINILLCVHSIGWSNYNLSMRKAEALARLHQHIFLYVTKILSFYPKNCMTE